MPVIAFETPIGNDSIKATNNYNPQTIRITFGQEMKVMSTHNKEGLAEIEVDGVLVTKFSFVYYGKEKRYWVKTKQGLKNVWYVLHFAKGYEKRVSVNFQKAKNQNRRVS